MKKPKTPCCRASYVLSSVKKLLYCGSCKKIYDIPLDKRPDDVTFITSEPVSTK